MYELVLALHSWLRWAAVAAGVVATIAPVLASPQPAAGRRSDRSGLVFMITMDLQLLLGLLLYLLLSPTTAAIFENFGASMRDPVARFWAVEHISLMLFAVVMVHVGRVLARKAQTPGARRRRRLIAFGLATVAMLAATPWPGMASGRPLFRL